MVKDFIRNRHSFQRVCEYWRHGAGERTSVKEVKQVDKLAIEAAPEASSQAIDVPGHNPHAAAGIVCGPALTLCRVLKAESPNQLTLAILLYTTKPER